MEQYIPKAATIEKVREIIKYAELYIEYHHDKNDRLRYSFEHQRLVMYELLSFLNTLEVKEFQEKNLYVVTRCEEHSDYVEKAFFSKKKAEEYCKQFESNENAYGRDITEIKVDCPPFEVKEVELYNNGWIDCTKQMPPETKQTSDTLQGHREWTESDMVLVWDSMYGCSVDVTKNGKWMSERRGGYTGQLVHGIIAWRPIPKFSEELLLKAQKGK